MMCCYIMRKVYQKTVDELVLLQLNWWVYTYFLHIGRLYNEWNRQQSTGGTKQHVMAVWVIIFGTVGGDFEYE
jgi:hypothetical protein